MDLSSLRALWPLVSRWAGARPSIMRMRIYALCKKLSHPFLRLFPTPSVSIDSKALPSRPLGSCGSRSNHSSHCHSAWPPVPCHLSHHGPHTGALAHYSSSAFPTRQKPFHRSLSFQGEGGEGRRRGTCLSVQRAPAIATDTKS
jgi:hypothetical protein